MISYAQNLEDVILGRALGSIQKGFYIDVGAQDPRVDSVSRAFYELGWRGLHVEPTRQYADLLRRDRPDEIVLEVALGGQVGIVTLWEVANTGLSTTSPEQGKTFSSQGHPIRELKVPCLTLDTLLEQYASQDIHWLKIDVEGMEQTVLHGWGNSLVRPWVVVVESTVPQSRRPHHKEWEAELLSRGYTFAYFDGLNRFYVSEKHTGLLEGFAHPPCVFDGYMLSGYSTASNCQLLTRRINQLTDDLNEISELYREAQKEIVQLSGDLVAITDTTRSEFDQRAAEASERINALLSTQDTLGKRVTELKEGLNDKSRLNIETRRQYDGCIKELQEAAGELQETRASLGQQNQELRDNLTGIIHHCIEARNEAESHRTEFANAIAHISTLQNALESLSSSVTQISRQLKEGDTATQRQFEETNMHLAEVNRLRILLHSASVGKHLYRAWRVFVGDKHYCESPSGQRSLSQPRKKPIPSSQKCKSYSNLHVAWHTHLYRAGFGILVKGVKPWHTHLYRAFCSMRGDIRYNPLPAVVLPATAVSVFAAPTTISAPSLSAPSKDAHTHTAEPTRSTNIEFFISARNSTGI